MTIESTTADELDPADDELRERATDVFVAYMTARSPDDEPDVEPLCALHPELADALRAHLADFLQVRREITAPGASGPLDLDELLDDSGLETLEPADTLAGVGPTGPPPGDIDEVRGLFDAEDVFVARYEHDREIDHGAMGTIHRVWDRRLERYLAMKVLRDEQPGGSVPGVRAFQRFHSEALVTAQLDHPGILPVHDIGLDEEGRVYFTMKYVKGRRNLRVVFDMVRRNQEGWTVNRAVGTVLRVCEAVAYAHSKRVLHRDIKPANIMVGQFGETYLLDWGLARRLDQPDIPGETEGEGLSALVPHLPADESLSDAVVESWLFSRDGKVMGTPPYMSPEQARGEVDRVDERSDVYSLGALLYHLLTGRPPFVEDGENPLPIMVLARVQREPPRAVVEMAPDAPPGLVAICERAMAREPEGRFPSAAEMAAELEDYLEDISEAREEARRQAQRATSINEFLVRMLGSADPRQARGANVTVLDVLDRFGARIGHDMGSLPYDEAGLRRTIGNVYKELGRHEPAQEHLERALALFEQELGTDHRETLEAATDLAVLHRVVGNRDRALGLLREVLEVQEHRFGAEHLDTLRTLSNIAEVLIHGRDDLEEACDLLERVVAGRQQQLGAEHASTLLATARLVSARWDLDQSDESLERRLQVAVRGLLSSLGTKHPEVLQAMSELGKMQQSQGRLPEAERMIARTLEGQNEVLGPRHSETLLTAANLAWLRSQQGRYDEGEAQLREVIKAYIESLGPDSRDVLVFRNNLAKTIQLAGRTAEALEQFEALVLDAERVTEGRGWHLGRIRYNAGCCLVALGERPRARRVLERARDELAGVLGDEHVLVIEAQVALAALAD